MTIRAACLPIACATLLGGLAAPGQAQSFARCQAAASGVTTRLLDCDAAELGARDAQLNQAYARLLHALPASRQAGLRAAERAWVGFRDAECAFRASGEAGGSDAPLIAQACRLELTGGRIKEIRQGQVAAGF